MSLSKYNKIPKGITIKEAYGKIRNYYQQLVNSPDKPKWLDQKTEDYISSLSEPAKVSNKEIRNLFREVLSGCLESGYNYDDGDYAICTYAKAVYDLNHDCFKLDEDVKPFNRTLTHLTTNPGSIKDKNFAGFSSLESITIFDPDSVLSIGYGAFFNCSSLISIKIPNSVTSIGYCAFSHCSSLISVTIPNGVKSIENSVFHGCSSLMSITIPDSVTTIDWGAFRSCSSLKNIKIPNGVTSIGECAFRGCESLTSIIIPNGVPSIGDGAFEDCSSLTSVTIPDSVSSIGNDAFWGCSKLQSIIIPNSVTSIGRDAFNGCNSLTIYCRVSSKPIGWDNKWNNDWKSNNRLVKWAYTGK